MHRRHHVIAFHVKFPNSFLSLFQEVFFSHEDGDQNVSEGNQWLPMPQEQIQPLPLNDDDDDDDGDEMQTVAEELHLSLSNKIKLLLLATKKGIN